MGGGKSNTGYIGLVIIGVFVFLYFIGSTEKANLPTSTTNTESQKTPTPPPSRYINSEFHQVGYYKTDKLRGLTFFVENPNRKDIEAFCIKKKVSFDSGFPSRVLKMHFYDDKLNTPDVTLTYQFPDSSQQYLVADYFFNPFNNKRGLKFHKDIPYGPPLRED